MCVEGREWAAQRAIAAAIAVWCLARGYRIPWRYRVVEGPRVRSARAQELRAAWERADQAAWDQGTWPAGRRALYAGALVGGETTWADGTVRSFTIVGDVAGGSRRP